MRRLRPEDGKGREREKIMRTRTEKKDKVTGKRRKRELHCQALPQLIRNMALLPGQAEYSTMATGEHSTTVGEDRFLQETKQVVLHFAVLTLRTDGVNVVKAAFSSEASRVLCGRCTFRSLTYPRRVLIV